MSGDEGRLDRPPPPARLARLPAALHRRYMIGVDTEEEFDWGRRRQWLSYGVSAAQAIPAMHRRFVGAGARPIYLVDYPIADAPEAVAAVNEALEHGGAEIGAQLHPWVTPPEGLGSTFAGALPEADEEAKIATLVARIEAAFGIGPVIYRAGRYGVGPNSAEILLRHGFALDLSPRPLFNYAREGGVDFRRFGPHPFRAGQGGELLVQPLGVALTGALRGGGWRLYAALAKAPFGLSFAARARLLSRVALTPEGMPFADAAEAVRLMLGEGVPILSFAFHSPSLVPGNTPYVRDQGDLAAFHRWWDAMFGLLARLGVSAISGGELIAGARAMRD